MEIHIIGAASTSTTIYISNAAADITSYAYGMSARIKRDTERLLLALENKENHRQFMSKMAGLPRRFSRWYR